MINRGRPIRMGKTSKTQVVRSKGPSPEMTSVPMVGTRRINGSLLWPEGVFEKLMCGWAGAKKQNTVGSEGAGQTRL